MTTAKRRVFAKPKLAEVKVTRREDLTHDLYLMWIEKPEGFTFKAGQYCTIGLDGIERPYSISSAPYEDEIELYVETLPPDIGVLTPKLDELVVGDSVTIRPRAKGIFTFKPRWPNQVLVGTVTGMCPYVSFLREYIHAGKEGHRFYILEGASYVDEFGYDREFTALEQEHPDLLTFVPTVSRPAEERNAGWSGQTGRVNLILEEYVEQWGLAPEDTLIYACGHPEMIEDVKARMGARGYKVEEERFWKES